MSSNDPLDLPQPPPELTAILADPRLEGMKDAPSYAQLTRRVLAPANPPHAGESRFLLLEYEYDDEDEFGDVTWLNKPPAADFTPRTGNGRGFAAITDTPRFIEDRAKPAHRADAWRNLNWLVASSRFAAIVRRFDPDAIATVPIDWQFADGQKLAGYVFLDVLRRIYAYDYARTEVWVEMEGGRKFIAGLGHPRALKRDIDPTLHIFRDAYYRTHLYVSRALARALSEAGLRGIRFEDPVSIDTVEFS